MNSIGQTVRKQKCRQTDGWTDKNGQTNERNFTNLERNLAMMAMYVPVKFEFDWTVFELESGNKNVDGQMDGQKNGQKTNGQKNGQTTRQSYTNFERNLAMMVMYVPVKFDFDWTNRFRVRDRKQKCGWTDGWTEKRTKTNKRTEKRTNKWKELHQFRKEPSYDGDLCP